MHSNYLMNKKGKSYCKYFKINLPPPEKMYMATHGHNTFIYLLELRSNNGIALAILCLRANGWRSTSANRLRCLLLHLVSWNNSVSWKPKDNYSFPPSPLSG